MNIKFHPVENISDSESDSDVIDSVRNSIEDFQPIVGEIGNRIEEIQKKLEGYENGLLEKLVSPRTDEFKNFWEHQMFPPTVPFQTVYMSVLSIAKLDINSRTVTFDKSDADRFAKGVQIHSIFSLIPFIIDGVTLL